MDQLTGSVHFPPFRCRFWRSNWSHYFKMIKVIPVQWWVILGNNRFHLLTLTTLRNRQKTTTPATLTTLRHREEEKNHDPSPSPGKAAKFSPSPSPRQAPPPFPPVAGTSRDRAKVCAGFVASEISGPICLEIKRKCSARKSGAGGVAKTLQPPRASSGWGAGSLPPGHLTGPFKRKTSIF